MAAATTNIMETGHTGHYFGHPMPKVRDQAIGTLHTRKHQMLGDLNKQE